MEEENTDFQAVLPLLSLSLSDFFYLLIVVKAWVDGVLGD